MSAVVYYLVIKPLSYLPLRILYGFSSVTYLFVYYIAGYRKEVVRKNIRNSFPDQNEQAQIKIEKMFYKHFCDLLVESLRIFSIPASELLKRMKVTNPEVLQKYFDDGRDVILVGGHYNNWEILAVCMNAQIDHLVAGIYTPLENSFFEKKFSKSRTRMGTVLVSKYEVKEYFAEHHKNPVAFVFGADQSPQFVKENTYWTTFLNQDTAVMFGTEKYAVEHDLPVIYMGISKLRRGYYETTFTLIEAEPNNAAYCSITEKHTQMLEMQIVEQPEFYLWTHKRWKHKKPNVHKDQ